MTDSNALPPSTEGSSNKTHLDSIMLTKKAGNHTFQDYYDQGWSDDLLVEHGFAVRTLVPLPDSESVNISYTRVKQPGTRLSKQQTSEDTFEPASPIYDALAETATETLKTFKERVEGIVEDECLILGTAEQPSCQIISGDLKIKGKGGVVRSKANFKFTNKPSLMLIDVDSKQFPHEIENPVEVIQRVVDNPLGCVVRSSTSANIYDAGGHLITDSKRCHIYVIIEDGTKIPSILKTLNKRLLLAGLGFVFISKSGMTQVRTFVDTSVGSPERIIFEADPSLLVGYTQERTTKYISGNILSIQELTEDEEQQVECIKAQLLKETESDIEEKRNAYAVERGVSLDVLNNIHESKHLPFEFMLTKNDNSTFSVADVWREPDKYTGISLRDPLEPDYGKRKAKIFVNRTDHGTIETITINSFAHGESTYFLTQPPQMLFAEVTDSNLAFKQIKPITTLQSVLDCPVDVLPKSLSGWIVDEAERMGCPIDFIVVGVIVTLSSLLGKKLTIKPKQFDDWTVTPNLWGACVGRPSTMKTPALKAATSFIRDIGQQCRENYKHVVSAASAACRFFQGERP